MDTRQRSSMVGGAILILLGLAFLGLQLLPGWRPWITAAGSWPLIVIGVGVLLFVLALSLATPPLAVPAFIVGGIGFLLLYQNATGNWESWAYAWTLIPGFVGLGVLVSGLLEGKAKSVLSPALWLILISAIAFVVLGSFIGAGRFALYWPIVLILGGLLLLGQVLFRRKA